MDSIQKGLFTQTKNKKKTNVRNRTIEERLDETENTDDNTGKEEDDPTIEAEVSTNPEDVYKSINLDQEINIDTILCKTETGRSLIECLKEGQNANDKMISQISHILCDCLRAVYGERPSTFHKEMIARSLVKTYPILGSAASDVPHALWFHKNGRGEGRHAGKIHYRMEYFAKKSDSRVIRRRQIPQQSQPGTEPDQAEPLETVEDFECLVNELKFSVPSEQTKTHIKNLWKRTIRYRNDHRDAGSFHTFLTDFPVASAFSGLLIMLDYEALHPKAADFRTAWNELQVKILERYRDKYRFLKNDFIRALAVVREKNPTRGSKRTREKDEQDLRKNNPLHGIIQWINADAPIPEPDVPQMVIRGEEFIEGHGALVWKNVMIPLDTDIISAFSLLCATFTVFNIKCSPSDKLFYGFFNATCFKVDALSTTGNKFLSLL